MRQLIARLGMLASLVLLPAVPAGAQDEEPNLEFFYPLVTRRPVIEREIELKLAHEKGREGRKTELAVAIEVPLLPRWQIELEIPLIFTDPRDASAQGGIGDLQLESKVVLFKSVEHRALVAAGVEARFPTGSERRGLGGETAIEPFLTAGISLGGFDILGEVAYEIALGPHGGREREQTLVTGLAVGYPLPVAWRLTPLIEVTTVNRLRGADEEDGPKLRGRAQVYLTPGINLKPLPRTTLRFGVQLPVTKAREFDYVLHGAFVREF